MKSEIVSRLLLLCFVRFIFSCHISFAYERCNEDQSSLLLQTKESLSFSLSTTPGLMSWDSATDCCSWKGVTCNVSSCAVIGLDLSEESITSGIDNDSALFKLQDLRRLNLAYNNIFNSAPIPAGIDQLTSLTHLNLSNSGFGGQIPVGISRLKRLVSLDISVLFSKIYLKLETPDLATLVRDLHELRELYLDGLNISMHGTEWSHILSSALPNLRVLSLSYCHLSGPPHSSLLNLHHLSDIRLDGNNMSSQVPSFFGNFSKLSSLSLSDCDLLGKFPAHFFQLPLLKSLEVSSNFQLQGSLPAFPQNSLLEILVLSNTAFSGKLPASIGNLRFLSMLDISGCSFSGLVPTSMSNLTQLQHIDLSSNNLTGSIPYFSSSQNLLHINLAHNQFSGTILSSQWGGYLKLTSLHLRNNSLSGTVPSILFTLPSLQKLDLSQNCFTGQLSEFQNGSSLMLEVLDVSNNMLYGPIPSSVFKVTSLKILALSSNSLNGTLRLGRFQNMKNLSYLNLSGNDLWINTSGADAWLLPQFSALNLVSCNLRTFPNFLIKQSKLSYLDLSNNQIGGKIPNWLGKIGKGNLVSLNLSFNLLEDPDQPFPGGLFRSLGVTDLQSNLLQHAIPILPRGDAYTQGATVVDYSHNNMSSVIPQDIGTYLDSTIFFSLSHNSFRGEIPSSICQAPSLLVLDLSNNDLSGQIPGCLTGLFSLKVLNLRGNKFHGRVPNMFPYKCILRTLDVNGNRLEGEVSKSVAKCADLEVLDLGNNQINGTFPSWLGGLVNLRVLVLRQNKFRGHIKYFGRNGSFPMLQIVDLSSNNFTGILPPELFMRLQAMVTNALEVQILRFPFLELSRLYYQDGVTITNKGIPMELVKILTLFTCIDFSNNQFHGEIPKVIRELTALYVLNLSHNSLTGSIPSSFRNLKQLGSLDLSNNKLSGEILHHWQI